MDFLHTYSVELSKLSCETYETSETKFIRLDGRFYISTRDNISCFTRGLIRTSDWGYKYDDEKPFGQF